MKRFDLSNEAKEDLDEIRTYLVKQGGAGLAKLIFVRLRAAIKLLVSNPLLGHTREDLTLEPVLFWPVFSYLSVYDPKTKPLGIARVLHGNRDLEILFRATPPQAKRQKQK